MNDKHKIRLLRGQVKRTAQYLDDVSDFLGGPDWKTDKDSGVGSIWRSLHCALKLTENRKPRRKGK